MGRVGGRADPQGQAVLLLTTERLFAFSIQNEIAGQSTSSGTAQTQIGRVTIAVLAINDPEVVDVRRAMQDEGVFWR